MPKPQQQTEQHQTESPEASAQRLLDELKITTVPVPVEKIPKMLGALLRYSPLDDELSGMAFVKDGTPIIGVNALHHPNRQRFTIAHEIAHLYLHKEHITGTVHVDKGFPVSVLKRDAASAAGTERLEIQANQFAAALLMPRKVLDQVLSETRIDIDDEAALESCAKKFKVSKATLEFRIRNLTSEPVGE
jgi:Zn-dependent peptidase ImmA (M78 family)